MKRRTALTTIAALAFGLACSREPETRIIPAYPTYFKDHDAGKSGQDICFIDSLDTEKIYLILYHEKELKISPTEEYPGLSAIEIKNTETMDGKGTYFYSIERLIME